MTRHEVVMWEKQELKAIEAERVRRPWESTGAKIDWTGGGNPNVKTRPMTGGNVATYSETASLRAHIHELEQENRGLKAEQQDLIRRCADEISRITARSVELQGALRAAEEVSTAVLKDLKAALARIKFLTGEVPYTPQKDERYSAVI